MATSNTSSTPAASMVSGHMQYAKGYAEETIGNVTGSQEWQESGKEDSKSGIDEMRVRFSFALSSLSLFLLGLGDIIVVIGRGGGIRYPLMKGKIM